MLLKNTLIVIYFLITKNWVLGDLPQWSWVITSLLCTKKVFVSEQWTYAEVKPFTFAGRLCNLTISDLWAISFWKALRVYCLTNDTLRVFLLSTNTINKKTYLKRVILIQNFMNQISVKWFPFLFSLPVTIWLRVKK